MLFAALLLVAAACGDDSAETDAAGSTDLAMEDDSADDESMEDMDHGDDGDDHGHGHGHDHGSVIEVPEGMAAPTISISATADTKSGHNLFVDLANFEIAPRSASTDAVDGEGHLHLYIDGERVMRFYNTAIHLTGLSPGDHEVMVEVSANNHSAYAIDGEPIRAMTTVTVADDSSDGHSHGDDAVFESANPPAIALEVIEDPKSGHNLFVDISNFTFAPESVGGEAVDGEGHLHLMIDGESKGRLYGPWTHLALEPGTHQVMIEVAGNDHVAYGADGAAITAMATIEVADDGDAETHDDETHDEGSHDEAAHDDGSDDATEDDNTEDDGHGHSHGGTGETLDMAAADADVVITASLTDGDLETSDRRYSVSEGQTVGIVFTSDEADEIHVHGYDILAEVGPGITADIAFLADSPGTFEVEMEGTGRFLFEIQVR